MTEENMKSLDMSGVQGGERKALLDGSVYEGSLISDKKERVGRM